MAETVAEAAASGPEAPGSQVEEASEHLCTLQPAAGSKLAQSLLELRAKCQAELSADETGLYPPHVSVTGFFQATSRQAEELCQKAAELVKAAREVKEGALDIELRKIISTDCGHVLVDVFAPGAAALAQELATWGERSGVELRPKAVRHLSLASRRPKAERARIARLFEALPLASPCQLEFVVSRLARRSTVQQLRQDGQVHSFSDLMRLPLPRSAATSPSGCRGAPAARCEEVACACAAKPILPPLPPTPQASRHAMCGEWAGPGGWKASATPLKKRHSEPTSAEEALLRQVTPPKFAKVEGRPRRQLARLASCPACVSLQD